MSKLEMILGIIIVSIILGSVTYRYIYFKSRNDMLVEHEDKRREEQRKHSVIKRNNLVQIGNDCARVLERGLSVAKSCQRMYELLGEGYTVSPERRKICVQFYPVAQQISKVAPLLKSGNAAELKKLCEEIKEEIPPGF